MGRRGRWVLLMGVVVAAILVPLVGLSLIWLPFQHARGAVLERLPTPLLARILIGPAGADVVADTRAELGFMSGVAFFVRPHHSAGPVCAVQTYWVPKRYIRADRKGTGRESMTSATAFAVPGDPSSPDAPDCAAYRDFEHLMRVSNSSDPTGSSVATMITLLDDARDAASAGQVNFTVKCETTRETQEKRPCDGLAFLKSFDLKRVNWVEVVEEDWSMSGTYRVSAWEPSDHDHPLGNDIVVSGRQIEPGEEMIVTSVTISRFAG